ncbi:unnamed protein product [Camellia sinensis]
MRGERLEMEVQEESEEKVCSFAKLFFFWNWRGEIDSFTKLSPRRYCPQNRLFPSAIRCVRWVARGFGAGCVGRIVCGSLWTETYGQPLIWAETLLQLHRSKPISLTHKFSPPPCACGAQTDSTTRSNPAEDARLPPVGGLGLPEMFGSTQDTASLSQFMQNPAVSQMMQSLLSNPQYMNQILGLNSQQSNMLGSNSQLREMMQNPEFIRQLTSPETMQSTHDFTANSFVSAWLATINPGSMSNPWGNRELQKTGTLDNMGLEMLMNMFGGLGIGSPAVPVRSDVPPEELYATQLSQLQEMGFFDTRENLQALIATVGNVHAAVERLLGNPVLAEAAKAQFSRDCSDNLALVRAYEAWKEAERDVAGYEYCWKNFLFAQSMKVIDAL